MDQYNHSFGLFETYCQGSGLTNAATDLGGTVEPEHWATAGPDHHQTNVRIVIAFIEGETRRV